MRTQIDKYECDWKDCKATFVDRNSAAVGDRSAPPEWGHASVFHMAVVQVKKNRTLLERRRYRRNRQVHLCPEHANTLLSLVRHKEEVE